VAAETGNANIFGNMTYWIEISNSMANLRVLITATSKSYTQATDTTIDIPEMVMKK